MQDVVTQREREVQARDDREAKAIIGAMLALQVMVLLSTMLWG